MEKHGQENSKTEKCWIELQTEDEKSGLANNNNLPTTEYQNKTVFPKRYAVDLQFEDVRYTAIEWAQKKYKNVPFKVPIPEKKEILHGVSGQFSAGELTAIMGPSGAGKSTLLNVLAAFTLRNSSGTININGRKRDDSRPEDFKRLSCYIQQDDCLREELTVGEAMTYAIDLKLGCSLTKKEKHTRVTELLGMLGLSLTYNTPSSGLSGGQKKRLSIALELISNPPIIFLDEPTTGLDSSSCSSCVKLLKTLAEQGRTVICTIHQPSALLFDQFDYLYTLSSGNCIYSGKVKDLVEYLKGMNLVCPQYHNPADFLLDVAIGEYGADIDALTKAASKKTKADFAKPALPPSEKELTTGINNNIEEVKNNSPDESKMKPANLFLQFWLLLHRKCLMSVRSPWNKIIRMFAHISIALLFGYIYRDVGSNANTVLANYCYLYGSILFVVYTGKMSVTLLFPMEMWTVTREHFNRWYKLGPYYLSMMVVEIPFQILCCYLYLPLSFYLTGQPMEWDRFWYYSRMATMSSIAAQAFGFLLGVTTPRKIAVFLGPVLACLLSVFGFCLRYADTPTHFRWLYHISYFRAAFQTSVYSMYDMNRAFLNCDDLYCHFKNPKKFLSEMDMPEISLEFNLVFVLFWALVLHFLTVIVVWFRLNKK